MNKYESQSLAVQTRLEERAFSRCGKKKRFSTEEEARSHNTGQEAYQCEKCGHWHLSSALSRLVATVHTPVLPPPISTKKFPTPALPLTEEEEKILRRMVRRERFRQVAPSSLLKCLATIDALRSEIEELSAQLDQTVPRGHK